MHITKNGRDYLVLLAAQDLESIAATLELLADPAARQLLAESERDVASGDLLGEANARRLLVDRRRRRDER